MKALVCIMSLFVFASCSHMGAKKSCCKTKDSKCKDGGSCELKDGKKSCCSKKKAE